MQFQMDRTKSWLIAFAVFAAGRSTAGQDLAAPPSIVFEAAVQAAPYGGEPAPISSQQWHDVLQRLEQTERELRAMREANIAQDREISSPHAVIGWQTDGASPNNQDPNAPNDTKDAPPQKKPEPPKPADKPAAPEFPKVKITGFMHVDAGWFGQDATSVASVGDIQDGAGFRRARLQAVGSVAEFTNYSLEMDFATAGRPSFQDVWLEQTHLPVVGAVRIGHFRQPCTMDSYTPIRQLTFLERPLLFQAFDPFRRTGVMAYDKSESELTTWQNSIYRTGGFNNGTIGDSRFGTDIGDEGGFSYASRMTHLLWYDEAAEGRYLLHIGGNFTYGRNTEDDNVANTPFFEARAIPEFFVGDAADIGNVATGTPFFADTGRLRSRDFELYGVELAGQYGPMHFQSEYLVNTVSQIGGPALFYDGAYGQVGYFLTGENRSYNRTFGAFDRVTPFEDFFSLEERGFCGWGAWEVAARISYLNLNDPEAAPIAGFRANPGRMTDTTVGLNWYWNAYTKLQFNWIHVMFDSVAFGDSDTDIYACRAQLEF